MKQKQYVNVLDIKFYVSDEDGNEILNKDGTTKEFYFRACNKYLDGVLMMKFNDGRLKPLEYLCEDITVEDLEEVKWVEKNFLSG